MGITKREIASELGVSKRTVANYIEKLGLGNHVSRNGNTDFLDDFAAAAIADALKNPGKPSRQPAAAPAPDSLVDSLAAQLEIERSRNAELMEALAAERDRAARAELIELMRTAGRTPIERAKKLWPEWYQARIVEGKAPGRWTCKRDLYDWWLGEVETKATDHHRYWCLNVLAAYARKCGIPYDELEADALALVPTLEGLTVREDNHFTEDHALAAIEAYYDPIIHKLTRERIERRTAIELPKNKRNGRKQAVHLARARTVQEFDDPDGAWRNKDGAPTKADLVREYAAEHPDANHSEIARALGISRPTVIKWLKDVPKGATEPEKPKPDDLYELYNPAMVELRAALDQYSSSANDRGYLSPPQSAMTRLELTQKAIGLDTGVEEYWKRVDVENEKREKRERETVKSSGTTVKLPDVSRETFPIDDRLNNGHNEA